VTHLIVAILLLFVHIHTSPLVSRASLNARVNFGSYKDDGNMASAVFSDFRYPFFLDVVKTAWVVQGEADDNSVSVDVEIGSHSVHVFLARGVLDNHLHL
jgi:hypothetical protein